MYVLLITASLQCCLAAELCTCMHVLQLMCGKFALCRLRYMLVNAAQTLCSAVKWHELRSAHTEQTGTAAVYSAYLLRVQRKKSQPAFVPEHSQSVVEFTLSKANVLKKFIELTCPQTTFLVSYPLSWLQRQPTNDPVYSLDMTYFPVNWHHQSQWFSYKVARCWSASRLVLWILYNSYIKQHCLNNAVSVYLSTCCVRKSDSRQNILACFMSSVNRQFWRKPR